MDSLRRVEELLKSAAKETAPRVDIAARLRGKLGIISKAREAKTQDIKLFLGLESIIGVGVAALFVMWLEATGIFTDPLLEIIGALEAIL